ncbi:Alpha/Beta hydrolase protein [Dunaliella salina]|uniref:Alpha/Beta hydrolase protein n=1 Tax=Dunaliella salina TaxID=3046 RepID=A0ABQ7GKE1_DUNSA|nr:Alpha/Beta hydrolase protein [Dunaliella salina]|eukprot:KAF5835085.1 Alpha/Beta hydrolase protein [Dunaliella salina]
MYTNRGPGCSSVGGGFLSELGAFLPKPDGKTLQANPYAWNKVASTLFVDSPAFVGWSYSENPKDAIVGDARTSTVYAGHYVPNLAWTVVQGNQEAGGKGQPGYLNLMGIMVGNPWTDPAVDNKGAVDYWWSHALIGDDVFAGINDNCDFSSVGPLDAHPTVAQPVTKEELCNSFCGKAFEDLSNINIYHIYADVCPPARVSAPARALLHVMQRQNLPLQSGSSSSSSMAGKPAVRRSALGVADTEDDDGDSGGPATEYDACIDNEVEAYLNQPDVQRALHANVTGKLPGPWQDCSSSVVYSYEDLLTSMLPVWHNLLSTGGLRFLVYSGDVDGIVPVVGTRRWGTLLPFIHHQYWRPLQDSIF